MEKIGTFVNLVHLSFSLKFLLTRRHFMSSSDFLSQFIVNISGSVFLTLLQQNATKPVQRGLTVSNVEKSFVFALQPANNVGGEVFGESTAVQVLWN